MDTPGTNALLEHHEVLTRTFLPRADLILFVTSADRPLTRSEAEFLRLIRDWGKKVVLVVNKADLLSEEDREAVARYVAEGARAVLGRRCPFSWSPPGGERRGGTRGFCASGTTWRRSSR